MSWFYSINGVGFESKDCQPLRQFLDEVAASLAEREKYNLNINELTLTFNSECMGVYDLPVKQAQDYIDNILADYAADADEDERYGSYRQQVQSYYNSTRF